MILDALLKYSDSQAVSGAAVSDNIVQVFDPRYNDTVDFGTGKPVVMAVFVEAGTAAGVNSFVVETSADEAFTAPVVIATGEIPAGAERGYAGIPLEIDVLPYVRVSYTFADALTVSTYLQPHHELDAYRTYRDNSTITTQ